jgi:peptidoglycan/LPS O-acetylase OafA/YrhL
VPLVRNRKTMTTTNLPKLAPAPTADSPIRAALNTDLAPYFQAACRFLAANAVAKEAPKPNWGLLGVMRFVLAMAVVCYHIDLSSNLWHLSSGRFAVYGFLIVSGFSIAHSLSTDKKNYLQRRVWRIYPVWITSIVIGFITIARHDPVLNIVGSVLMLQGILTPVMCTLGSSWTLAGEWWMYMIAPLLTVKRAALASIIFLATAAVGFAFVTHPIYPKWSSTMLMVPCLWISGYLLYKRQTWAVAIIGLFTAASCFFWDIQPIGVIYVIAITAIIVQPPKINVSAIGRLLGDVSYPLYLIHPLLLTVLRNEPAIIRIAAAFASAFLIHLLIEKPILALRSRLKTKAPSSFETQPS